MGRDILGSMHYLEALDDLRGPHNFQGTQEPCCTVPGVDKHDLPKKKD